MNEIKPGEEMERDRAEGNDRGDDLVLGQDRSEAADREIKHPEQEQHQIGAEISADRVRRRLMRDHLEDQEVEKRRNPEHEVKDERAEELREHDLPVAHRRGHERLDRAELKFLREEPHRDQRKNQDEREPEEDRVKEGFLDRVRHRPGRS